MVWYKVSIKGDFYCEANTKEEAHCKAYSEFQFTLKNLEILNSTKEVPKKLPFSTSGMNIWDDFYKKE